MEGETMQKGSLTVENLPSGPIVDGDVGVILKQDGSFRVFNCRRDMKLEDIEGVVEEQGRKLLGLAAALSTPALMDFLVDVATDPEASDVFAKTLLN
jgi:hypothetical protein